MKNSITVTSHTVTMTSLELVEIINSLRDEGRAELLHKNFMAKIESHPGIDSAKFLAQYKDSTGRSLKCYSLPRRESELMIMSESLEVQTKVYDRMTQLEQVIHNSQPTMHVSKATSDLAPLRKQRAISLAIDNGDKIKQRLPLLGDAALQSLYAGLVNTAAGTAIIPMAILEEKHKNATEIGKLLGVHRNTIGKIANANQMKTKEYGHWELGEAEFNSSQRETFVYNAKAVQKFRELLSSNDDQKEGAA